MVESEKEAHLMGCHLQQCHLAGTAFAKRRARFGVDTYHRECPQILHRLIGFMFREYDHYLSRKSGCRQSADETFVVGLVYRSSHIIFNV